MLEISVTILCALYILFIDGTSGHGGADYLRSSIGSPTDTGRLFKYIYTISPSIFILRFHQIVY